jgi:glutathione S-transferase
VQVKSKEYIELKGVPGSPYTRKMLALLRYRRIPYRLLQGARHQLDPNLERFPPRPQPKVELLPTFYLEDDDGAALAVCDSTPVIRFLESSFADRAVVPSNGTLVFINYLIEDYADEWLTKAMFHYRWSYPADIKKAGQMLPRWGNSTADEQLLQEKSKAISELQISRLSYVGSNSVTAKTIEQSFIKFLKVFDKHLQSFVFILGNRPSSCDFAIFGQLTCMALFDPTPQALILEYSPRVYAWTETLEDLSGYELLDDDWMNPAELPESLVELLGEIGRVYSPYLLANAEAHHNGERHFQCEIDGRAWHQSTFPYQAKCLKWLRKLYNELDEDSKAQVTTLCNLTNNSKLLNSG